MSARDLPAAPVRFAVTLKFSDGIYKRQVIAESQKRAIELALVDARMASPFSSHYGALLESSAEIELPSEHAAWHLDMEIVGWAGMS